MEKSVDEFNNLYAEDLEYLGFEWLSCDGFGKVDVSEIRQLTSLYEAFIRVADRSDNGYTITCDDGDIAYYENY
jgi:hypothetical protein